jgi:hypothetical protein
MKLPTTPVNSSPLWDQHWINPGTCRGPKLGTDSGVRVSGRSQYVLLSREIPDSRGAAAARLLLRTTLDPLSGLTPVNTPFSTICGHLSTGVNK